MSYACWGTWCLNSDVKFWIAVFISIGLTLTIYHAIEWQIKREKDDEDRIRKERRSKFNSKKKKS